MFRVPTTWLAVVLIGGAAPVKDPQSPPAKVLNVASARQQPSPNEASPYDAEAERELFDLANKARAQAGVAPLQMDDGLTQAARAHASVMAGQQQLSHQFAGEPSLAQRLAATCTLHLDQAGENVSVAGSVDQSHQGLMHSPPHRENLLNPGYNVAGFGVVRAGPSLYVTQDFGHSLPAYSPRQAGGLVSGSVARIRREANLPQLQWMDSDAAESAACSMARADSLKTVASRGSYIVRYTTAQPEILPDAAAKAIEDRAMHTFSVGTCYARTSSYPNGVYWVTLVLR
jgi:uncharacterized protein YkwD